MATSSNPTPITSAHERGSTRSGWSGRLDALIARLFQPVDIGTLVVFRIAFGIIMMWEVYRYFTYGWVRAKFVDPPMHFTYLGWEWVRPWPGQWMDIHFYALALTALCIAVGLWYRLAATLFFLLFTTLFLMEKAIYLNHFYLVLLVSFLMIFAPANRAFSMDAIGRPSWRSDTIPAWPLVLLAAQMTIVYVYGGIAKLNGDWLRGEPMRTWLVHDSHLPVIGRWVTEEWLVYAMSYGGLLLDLFIVPLILWHRTRWFAVVALVLFHRLNADMFSIGIFPMFATAAIVLFLPPDVPRRFVGFVRSTARSTRDVVSKPTAGAEAEDERAPVMPWLQRPSAQRAVVAFVGVYLAIQLLVPLRHHLYPGDPAWNEQADRFSWRMMLNTKQGEITFYVTDPVSGVTEAYSPFDYLTRQQAGDVVKQPDMALQFSHWLADQWRVQGFAEVEVRAVSWVSLNDHAPGLLIDPEVDLASVDLSAAPMTWLTTMEEGQELGRTFSLDVLLAELGSATPDEDEESR